MKEFNITIIKLLSGITIVITAVRYNNYMHDNQNIYYYANYNNCN